MKEACKEPITNKQRKITLSCNFENMFFTAASCLIPLLCKHKRSFQSISLSPLFLLVGKGNLYLIAEMLQASSAQSERWVESGSSARD